MGVKATGVPKGYVHTCVLMVLHMDDGPCMASGWERVGYDAGVKATGVLTKGSMHTIPHESGPHTALGWESGKKKHR